MRCVVCRVCRVCCVSYEVVITDLSDASAERKYFKQMELLQTTFRRIVVERRESGVRDDERDILACMLRESQKHEGQWVDDDEIIRQVSPNPNYYYYYYCSLIDTTS